MVNVKAESLVRINMQQDSNAGRLSSVFTEVNGTHVPLTDNTIYRANYGTMIILKMMVSSTYYHGIIPGITMVKLTTLKNQSSYTSNKSPSQNQLRS